MRAGPGQLAAVAAAGEYPPDTLSARHRWFLGVISVLAGIVAMTHQLLVAGTGGDAGVWGFVHAVLSWPASFAQPVVAAAGALVLYVLGAQTHGWELVTRTQSRPLLAATIAALAGAGPMILVCAVTAAFFALLIVLGIVIVAVLIAVLIAAM